MSTEIITVTMPRGSVSKLTLCEMSGGLQFTT
jgi:hypothetical protein